LPDDDELKLKVSKAVLSELSVRGQLTTTCFFDKQEIASSPDWIGTQAFGKLQKQKTPSRN
jgi:hypothetical protein